MLMTLLKCFFKISSGRLLMSCKGLNLSSLKIILEKRLKYALSP